jgi:methylated-DNA-[protein]-cysteine S-methyltransferase
MSQHFTLPSPIGPLAAIQISDVTLTQIKFLSKDKPNTQTENTFTKKLTRELERYFKNPDHTFDLSFELNGTDFQKKVWQQIKKIPRGKTATYKAIASTLKSSPRAVGNACRANPVPLIIPCHRVVGVNGLGGFAGDTSGKLLAIKKWLLAHETL